MAELVKPKRKQKHKVSKSRIQESSSVVHEEPIPDIGLDAVTFDLHITNPGSTIKIEQPVSDVLFSEKTLSDDVIKLAEDILPVVGGLENTLDIPITCEQTIEDQSAISQNEYTYTSNSPYTDLVKDLEKCLTDISVPSAPPIDFPEIANSTKTTVEAVIEHELPTEGPLMKELINNLNVGEDLERSLEPFGEEDLKLLYQNEQFIASKQYLEDFSKTHKPNEDELFTLMTQYVALRKSVREDTLRLEVLQEDVMLKVKELWTVWPNVKMTERSKCADGIDVILSHSYCQARFNEPVFNQFRESLTLVQQHVTEVLWPHGVGVQFCKKQIMSLLWDIQNCCPAFTQATTQALSNQPYNASDSFTKQCVERLSCAIGTLFYFLRKIPSSEDEELLNEIRTWLSGLLNILVLVGSWQQRLFVLCHVLRSPPTVATWAASYLQCPARPSDDACTLLNVLLRPVAGREVFLEVRESGKGPWVLVDGEGEDEDDDPGYVREHVLFQLLNQIPLQELLSQYIETDRNLLSELSLLRCLAFFSSLVETFQCGLLTYGHEHHRQFGKRLGQLLREFIELLTDQVDLFVGRDAPSPRVQVEYDAFVLKATRALLSSPCVWQFLAGAPLHRASSSVRYQIFLDFTFSNGCSVDQESFANKLSTLNDAERSHLLSALCNLALAPKNPFKLTRAVAYVIFFVGFVSPITRDFAYKDVKSLVSSLVIHNKYLLSELLQVYHNLIEGRDLDEECSQVELWQALPVSSWVPTRTDILTLICWLAAPAASNQREMAQCILRLLDYDFVSRGLQKEIAWAVVRASQGCNDPVFAQFCWTVLLKLRLHIVDGGGVSNDLTSVPDVAEDAELGLLVSQSVPSGVFLALQTTSIGHFVPVMYTKGFHCLRVLVNDRRYEAALHCIDCMTTMFWRCPDSLVSCQDFISLLGELVVLDDSYVKMVKSMIVSDKSAFVLRKFASMLHSHLDRCGVETLPDAVGLWMRALTSLPLWQHNSGALYLLDVVCRRAFTDPTAWLQVCSALESALGVIPPPEPRSPLSSLLRLSGAPSTPTLLPNGSNGNAPWFAYAAIIVEFEVYERRTSLWHELLRELWNGRGKKTSVDGSLKKVCSNLKLPIRSSAQLAFYRWAAQALEMPETHPLTILVWQKMLELFVTRVPGLVARGSPGDCFFHGVTNTLLLKRLQERLVSLSVSQSSLASTYKTLSLYLTEPVVLEANLLIASLPALYNPPLLAALLAGEDHPWFMLLPLAQMREDLIRDAAAWTSVLGRLKKRVKNKPRAPEHPQHRILRRLKELPIPSPLPKLTPIAPVLPKITLSIITDNSMFDQLERLKTFLFEYRKEILTIHEKGKTLITLSHHLYVGKQKEERITQACETKYQNNQRRFCQGPASILMKYVEWTQCPANQEQFDLTLAQFQSALSGMDINDQVVLICLVLERVVDMFVLEASRPLPDSVILNYGVQLYRQMLVVWKTAQCSVIASHLEKCIMKIGESYVGNRRDLSLNLLMDILNTPQAKFLLLFFNPNMHTGDKFVMLYKTSLEKSGDSALLARFDVPKWLQNSLPKVADRSKLVSVVFSALQSKQTSQQQPKTYELLNTHLENLLLEQFPEHYGEILMCLVQAQNTISPDCWYTFLNALAPTGLRLQHRSLRKSIIAVRNFATEQTLLSLNLLQETCGLLGGIWRDQRLHSGTLYSKYGTCTEPILTFLAMIGHALVMRLLATRPVLLSFQFVDFIWPLLEDLFAPWLVPYIMGNGDFQMPLDADNASLAEQAASYFTECVRFVGVSVGIEPVLNRTLRLFCSRFCMESVDGLVLSIMISHLGSLPWNALCPALADVEAILNVVNKYLPVCHGFLGNIFVSIDWSPVVRRSLMEYGTDVNAHLHACLLHLLVKFPSEPSLKQHKAMQQLVETSTSFSWHLVDASSYADVVTWFTCTCDPSIVLDDRSADYYEVDKGILRLLQVAAGYDGELQYFHTSTPAKRRLFVSALVKCLANTASRKKRKLPPKLIKDVITRMLNDVENIVLKTVLADNRIEEAAILLHEVLRLMAESQLSSDVEAGFVDWLSTARTGLVRAALLRCAGSALENPFHYGTLLETAVDSHFAQAGGREWQSVVIYLLPYAAGSVPVDQILISNGCFLTLYALCLVQSSYEPRRVLNTLMHMFATVKPCETSEPKLLLLAGLTLMLASTQPDAAVMLQTLADHLYILAADRGASFLSTIGLKKTTSPSISMKLCCMATATGIANLLLSKHEHMSENKSQQALERAEGSKQFLPVMPHVLNVKRELADVQDYNQLIKLVYSTAKELYNKYYFIC